MKPFTPPPPPPPPSVQQKKALNDHTLWSMCLSASEAQWLYSTIFSDTSALVLASLDRLSCAIAEGLRSLPSSKASCIALREEEETKEQERQHEHQHEKVSEWERADGVFYTDGRRLVSRKEEKENTNRGESTVTTAETTTTTIPTSSKQRDLSTIKAKKRRAQAHSRTSAQAQSEENAQTH